MIRRTLFLVGLCISPLAASAPPADKAHAKDLYLAEAYYQAAQGNYLDAISRLDTELWQHHRLDDPKLDPIMEVCAKYGRPIMIHIADPAAFFTPIDASNERYEELKLSK